MNPLNVTHGKFYVFFHNKKKKRSRRGCRCPARCSAGRSGRGQGGHLERARSPQAVPGSASLSTSLLLDAKSCNGAKKDGSTVRMKEFTAGSKAKTVQPAAFKCFVCPLDVPVETLSSGDDVCVKRTSCSRVARAPRVCLASGWVPLTREAGGPLPTGRGRERVRGAGGGPAPPLASAPHDALCLSTTHRLAGHSPPSRQVEPGLPTSG